jgi:hypothetical protein
MNYNLDELQLTISERGRGAFIHIINVLKGEIAGAKYLEKEGLPHTDYGQLTELHNNLWNMFPELHLDYEAHRAEMAEFRSQMEKR